jgi:hypothetical protein
VKPFVEAAQSETGKALLGFRDHRNGYLVISLFFHYSMMQNETAAVFQHAYPQSQFYRDPSLAFADPFGMWLKDREHLFVMGNGFPLDNPTADLIDLALGMSDIAVKGAKESEFPGQRA